MSRCRRNSWRLRSENKRERPLRDKLSRDVLTFSLRKTVFRFDAVELFEHGFRTQPQEEERGDGAHQIDRNAGDIVA